MVKRKIYPKKRKATKPKLETWHVDICGGETIEAIRAAGYPASYEAHYNETRITVRTYSYEQALAVGKHFGKVVDIGKVLG